ncbi:MAG TPA: metalloregulator ArsR/SmtB family transcription factor [Thermoanaerobaculia bacterium]|nr:metalloregulator ArsR/SmtB family transcription factor [Thermoanaerobaculia bacterium]
MTERSEHRGGEKASVAVTEEGPLTVTAVCAIMKAMSRKGMKLSPEAVELVAGRFRILGEPVRIRILQSLEEGEMNVSELVAAVGSTQPNVSKHLRILQEGGIVGRRQQGNNVYCYIADESVLELCEAVCGSLRTQVEATAKKLGVAKRR